MAIIFPPKSLGSILQLGQVLDTLPQVEKAGLKIAGYPEFAFTVNTLDAEQQKALNEFAAKIVASQLTDRPIRAVSIFGHADVTLREAPANRTRTENEVSTDRANAAMEALKDAIRQKGGEAVLGKIHMRAKGMGSAFREVIPARTEAEMRRNRRVEFFITEVILPPPTPKPPEKPPAQDLGRWTAQILSGTVASEGLTIVSVMNVNLTIEIVDLIKSQKATFTVVSVGQGLPGASVGLLGGSLTPTATLTKGDPAPFTTFRRTDLKSFAGRVAVFVDPGAAASVLATDSSFRISFEGMEESISLPTRPNPVPMSAGTRFDTAPQFGLGGVTHGPLILTKGPSPK